MRSLRRAALFAPVLVSIACAASSPAREAVADSRRGDTPSAETPLFDDDGSDPEKLAKAVAAHYTKYEYRIPMRDGAHLYTIAYVPREAKDMRHLAPAWQFVRDGYIFAHQDVRGRMMSEGTFVEVRPHAPKGGVDEATDAFDTIDFLVKNVPSCSGKVGVWGISYPGFYAAQSAVDAHPALKAVSPQAPVTDWFIGDDAHHNGALFLEGTFGFEASFGKPRPEPTKKIRWESPVEADDAYDFFLALGPLANADAKYFHGTVPFWNDLMSHGTRDDFWKARDPRPFYRDVKPAILTVGGWFDAEDLWGTLQTYAAFKHQSPKNDVSLVMGPWRHGGWSRSEGDSLGDVTFGAKTSLFFREQIEKPFFDHYLKGKPLKPTTAWAFETGTNVWERYSAWPPHETRAQDLFFHANGKLQTSAVAGPEGETDFDAWVSDPNKPVPYVEEHASNSEDYMVGDERATSRRPDVMVYETEPLAEDVTLAGPIDATLWVSTTGTDADFVVKVVDVYPQDHAEPEPNPTKIRMGGFQQLVRGEVMRGKFRYSFEHPQPFTPGEATLVRFSLPDVNHTFRASHRILVQVQSSWFPLVDRNPQTFVDIYKATEKDFKAATHQLYRSRAHGSGIRVSVLRGSLPAP